MSDLVLDCIYKRGDGGRKVRLIQEWPSVNGHPVRIDGDFGRATQAVVRTFQRACGLTDDGEVGAQTFPRLVASMRAALAEIAPAGRSLGDRTRSPIMPP
jgi:peptidoglycan hydrolase-like protein with peptidoglycan-binding domain